MFKHALMTWGDKFSASEVDDIFGEFEIDEDNMIKSKDVIGLFVAQKEEEKKVEEAAPVEVAAEEPAEEEEEGRQVKLLTTLIQPLVFCIADTSVPLVIKRRGSARCTLQTNTFPKT